MLVFLATIDLIVTAVLHAHGLIVEQNPLMRPLIERSEWLFAFVKALTIVGVYVAMRHYGQENRSFVRKTAVVGSAAYIVVWSVWFATGTLANLEQDQLVPKVVMTETPRAGHSVSNF